MLVENTLILRFDFSSSSSSSSSSSFSTRLSLDFSSADSRSSFDAGTSFDSVPFTGASIASVESTGWVSSLEEGSFTSTVLSVISSDSSALDCGSSEPVSASIDESSTPSVSSAIPPESLLFSKLFTFSSSTSEISTLLLTSLDALTPGILKWKNIKNKTT